ncbi:hypothetical protein [Paraburkholderia sp. MM5477-R1]
MSLQVLFGASQKMAKLFATDPTYPLYPASIAPEVFSVAAESADYMCP